MIHDAIQKALNDQLNAELYAGYIYLSMSAYFHTLNLTGFAHWSRIQARHELLHAMKIYDFVNTREGRVQLSQVQAPKPTWDGPLDAFQNAFEHEQKTTAQIYGLVEISQERRDHATHAFLQWFVAEQVAEEALTNDVVHKLELIGNSGNGLFLLDRELGQRPPTSPSHTTEGEA